MRIERTASAVQLILVIVNQMNTDFWNLQIKVIAKQKKWFMLEIRKRMQLAQVEQE
jgi:hypothetical protein